MTWMLFWKIVFIAVLSLFAVMSGLTIVFGAKDVRELLRGFEADTEERQSERHEENDKDHHG